MAALTSASWCARIRKLLQSLGEQRRRYVSYYSKWVCSVGKVEDVDNVSLIDTELLNVMTTPSVGRRMRTSGKRDASPISDGMCQLTTVHTGHTFTGRLYLMMRETDDALTRLLATDRQYCRQRLINIDVHLGSSSAQLRNNLHDALVTLVAIARVHRHVRLLAAAMAAAAADGEELPCRVYAYTYHCIVLSYGAPDYTHTVTIKWRAVERIYQVSFGRVADAGGITNPHQLVATQLMAAFNRTDSLSDLVYTLTRTLPLWSAVQMLSGGGECVPVALARQLPATNVDTFSGQAVDMQSGRSINPAVLWKLQQ